MAPDGCDENIITELEEKGKGDSRFLLYCYMHIGLSQQAIKLVFVELCPDYLSLRTSPQTGVAIPPLEGKCIDNCPTEQKT